MNQRAHSYSIGRLKGRYVATWWEGSKRRRFRLHAEDLASAEAEAAQRCWSGFQDQPTIGEGGVTYEQAIELLDYDPFMGEFTWRVQRSRSRPGARAGCLANGYVLIRIDGQNHLAHRLAWLLVHGRWPAEHIDHINGNGTDNRLSNLRECTHAENHQNQARNRNNRLGLHGVYFHHGNGQYTAEIRANKQRHLLGYFDTAEEAHAAYLAAKERLHTFQPVPRDV